MDYKGGILVIAYSSFPNTDTKDQTDVGKSSREKREADKQKERKGRIKKAVVCVRESSADKEKALWWTVSAL